MARRRMRVTDILEIIVAWDAGEGISQIARRLGYTRVTVRKYAEAARALGVERGGGRRSEVEWTRLAQAVIDRVAARRAPGAVAATVAEHHAYLEERVGQVHLSVLHQRLRDERGLAASWGVFYRYVAKHWPDRLRRAPRVTVRRDDPPPGEEAQVDFLYMGLWDDPGTGRRRRLYAFLLTLSHSRHQFLYPTLAEDSAAWLDGHVAAFAFLGGVPRRVVLDNLTAGITHADRYDPRVNRAYGELARHYGFLVDPTRVAHPQDKPRVERNVQYARESFFRGRPPGPLAALRADAARWCRDVAGQRLHGTTGERPFVAFQQREQAALQPLPPRPWEPAVWTSALVGSDCHLRAGGASYSVPYRHVNQRLEVRLGARTVQIYDGATLVTSHPRQERGRATRLDHYPEAGRAFLQGTPAACLRRAQEIGPAAGALVAALLAEPTLTRLREVQALLRLPERYPPERLERACHRATAAGDGRYRTVRGVLERELDGLDPEPEPAPQVAGAFLRGPAAFVPAGDERAEVAGC
jgi:transposase